MVKKRLIQTRKKQNKIQRGGDDKEIYYMSLDIEIGGISKPIFAIGVAIFKFPVILKNEENRLEFIEEKLFNYKVPEEYDDKYYEKDTWDYFWSKPANLEVIKNMNTYSNCIDEKDLIIQFYNWYFETTVLKKYDNLKILTDAPTFDIGEIDRKIAIYRPKDNLSLPLIYQWKQKDRNSYIPEFVSTIDYNSFEILFESFIDKSSDKLNKIIGDNPYIHDHNPLNDAKEQAYKFIKVFSYLGNKI
jgi:hypothetical protein